MNINRQRELALKSVGRVLLVGSSEEIVVNLVKFEEPQATEDDIKTITDIVQDIGLECDVMSRRYAISK